MFLLVENRHLKVVSRKAGLGLETGPMVCDRNVVAFLQAMACVVGHSQVPFHPLFSWRGFDWDFGSRTDRENIVPVCKSVGDTLWVTGIGAVIILELDTGAVFAVSQPLQTRNAGLTFSLKVGDVLSCPGEGVSSAG